jgi:hypothetical protein
MWSYTTPMAKISMCGVRVLAKMQFGSQLYGTATASSDTDIKTVYVPAARDILLQRATQNTRHGRAKAPNERNVATDIDAEDVPVQNFLRLLADGHPTMLDMLFAPAANMLAIPDPVWHEIVTQRERIVTRRAVRFINYCRTQAKRYGIRGSRLWELRMTIEWLEKMIVLHGEHARLGIAGEAMQPWLAARSFAFTEIVTRQSAKGESLLHLRCCDKMMPLTASLRSTRAVFCRQFDLYGERARQAETNEGVDWKAVGHAVRLGEQACEFLTTGFVTFPRPNAADLLAIRQGQVSYHTVATRIEALFDDIQRAAEASSLRDEPDQAFIDELVAHVHREQIIGM